MDNGSVPSLDEEELTLPIAAVNKLIKEAVPKYRVSQLSLESSAWHIHETIKCCWTPVKTNRLVQKANWMIKG